MNPVFHHKHHFIDYNVFQVITQIHPVVYAYDVAQCVLRATKESHPNAHLVMMESILTTLAVSVQKTAPVKPTPMLPPKHAISASLTAWHVLALHTTSALHV